MIKCFLPKTECLVIQAFNTDLLVSIEDKIYELRELNRNKTVSKEIDFVEEKPKERKIYKPATTHPWRLQKFKQHVMACHYSHTYA